jgi:hypothetical protein
MSIPQHADNIRQLLGHLIGQRLLEITSEDQEDRDAGRDRFVELMFENGYTVKFFLADGYSYRGGYPMCFSDPDPDPDAQDDNGFFHPKPEDVALHRWAVVEEFTPDGPTSHVIPCFGKLHFIGSTCWCNSAREVKDDGDLFWTHNEVAE